MAYRDNADKLVELKDRLDELENENALLKITNERMEKMLKKKEPLRPLHIAFMANCCAALAVFCFTYLGTDNFSKGAIGAMGAFGVISAIILFVLAGERGDSNSKQ